MLRAKKHFVVRSQVQVHSPDQQVIVSRLRSTTVIFQSARRTTSRKSGKCGHGWINIGAAVCVWHSTIRGSGRQDIQRARRSRRRRINRIKIVVERNRCRKSKARQVRIHRRFERRRRHVNRENRRNKQSDPFVVDEKECFIFL